MNRILTTASRLLPVLAPALLMSAPAIVLGADEGEDESPWVLGVALGHGRQSNPFVQSDDIDIHAVLDIAYYGERFFFDNGDFGLVLRETPTFSINAIATFNNERNYFSYLSDNDSGLGVLDSLSGEGGLPTVDNRGESSQEGNTGRAAGNVDTSLPDRDFSVNAGLEFLHISRWGDIQAQLLSDVSGKHHGQKAWLSYSYPWFTVNGEFALSVGMEWKSADLTEYYYGVRADEVLPGRPAYDGASGINPFARFSASYNLGGGWSAVSVMEREYLGSSIRHSPVVDRDTVDTFFLGLYYSFF